MDSRRREEIDLCHRCAATNNGPHGYLGLTATTPPPQPEEDQRIGAIVEQIHVILEGEAWIPTVDDLEGWCRKLASLLRARTLNTCMGCQRRLPSRALTLASDPNVSGPLLRSFRLLCVDCMVRRRPPLLEPWRIEARYLTDDGLNLFTPRHAFREEAYSEKKRAKGWLPARLLADYKRTNVDLSTTGQAISRIHYAYLASGDVENSGPLWARKLSAHQRLTLEHGRRRDTAGDSPPEKQRRSAILNNTGSGSQAPHIYAEGVKPKIGETV